MHKGTPASTPHKHLEPPATPMSVDSLKATPASKPASPQQPECIRGLVVGLGELGMGQLGLRLGGEQACYREEAVWGC